MSVTHVGPQVGDEAPVMTLKGTSGSDYDLASYRGKSRVLLVFYPQDQTSGCTVQLSAIRDTINDFGSLDTVAFGVNEAGAESHQAFIDVLDLPFELLVDDGFKLTEAYGALKPEGGRIVRTVVIIGKNGKVIYRVQGSPAPGELLSVIAKADD